MNRRAGFTLIEILITVTIMVTLLTLVVFSLRSSQANARDEERETDVANIIRGLESYYDNGDADHGVDQGHYPGRDQVDDAYSATPPYATNGFLPDVTPESFQAPNFTGTKSFFYGLPSTGEYTAGNVKSNGNLGTYPYLYQPLKEDDHACDDWHDCVKFNFYYMTEVDGIVHTIRSKNQ
jgi:prepilin-type N-terminal cleavage/methylation domain-containing protein